MTEICIMAAFLLLLAVGAIVADIILPRIRPLERFIDGLPAFWMYRRGGGDDDGPL